MNRRLSLLASILVLAAPPRSAAAFEERPSPGPSGLNAAAGRFRLELEGGATWQLRNDFAVPGDTGTRFSIDEANGGPFAAFRGTLWYDLGPRSSLRLLAAPLRTTATLQQGEPVTFNGTVFPGGTPLDVTYVFNSYRLSWIYRFRSSGPVSFRAGLTAKVRNAKIELAGGGLTNAKTNTGVVPLLHGGVKWQMSDTLALDLDVDALGASQGRAEDVALRLEARVLPKVDVFAGFRTLEGGADNDEVYTFSWFTYAIGGVSIRF